MLAVHRAEAVVDEGVGQGGQLVGERAPLGVVLARLAGLEADVLQQHATSPSRRPGRPTDGRRRLAHDVGRQRHRLPEQLGQPLGDRGASEYSGFTCALGPAQVRRTTTSAPASASALDRRQAGPDPAVVGDRRVGVERDVEVGPDEHASGRATPPGQSGRRVHAGVLTARAPTRATRSTSRLE